MRAERANRDRMKEAAYHDKIFVLTSLPFSVSQQPVRLLTKIASLISID